MIRKLKILLAMIVFSISFFEPALAGMRCGTSIITPGQRSSPSKYEVLKRCGEPKERYGDTWIYQKSSSVSYELKFDRDGKLYAIE